MLLDGIFEMLNIEAYCEFKGQKKEGGMDYDTAKADFHRVCAANGCLRQRRPNGEIASPCASAR